MNVKTEDLMSKQVVSIKPQEKVGRVKQIFKDKNINVLPVINSNEELVGIVSQSDILNVDNDFATIASFMSNEVITIPPYSDIQVAAQVMKKNHIHHLVVTLDKKVVGVISTYDLLKVISEHRFKAIHLDQKPNKRVA